MTRYNVTYNWRLTDVGRKRGRLLDHTATYSKIEEQEEEIADKRLDSEFKFNCIKNPDWDYHCFEAFVINMNTGIGFILRNELEPNEVPLIPIPLGNLNEI